MKESSKVCVVIAAHNAAETIADAVRSALLDTKYVAEVVVVDDASSDETDEAARAADDGSGRLRVLRLAVNAGPSAARNRAIAASQAPFLSVLDADDQYLPGRFDAVFAQKNWDILADNIAFVRGDGAPDPRALVKEEFEPNPRQLDFRSFVAGNLSRRGESRGELGFLKPVISRAFLDRTGLSYDQSLRLGEDYALYARALALGARFTVIENCGYLALVRSDSLSGRHRTADLERMADVDMSLLHEERLHEGDRKVLRAHERQVRRKFWLRRFLDIKNGEGSAPAFAFAMANPQRMAAIVEGVGRDKIAAYRRAHGGGSRGDTPSVRYLFYPDRDPATAESALHP